MESSNKVLLYLGSLSVCFTLNATESALSNQSLAGYSGAINTPNAEVQKSGVVSFGYNNQLDFRGNKYIDGHNFIFSAGLFDYLEVSGLIASNSMHDNLFVQDPNSEGQTRDLSFNAKYKVPFIPKNWFELAVGAKDIGGAANNYETYYAVASKEWKSLRFSTGFSVSDRVHGQMDGAFGSVEWQALDWLSFQVEHDSEAFNSGLKVTVPKAWLFDLGELTLSSKFYSNTEYSYKDTYWGATFSFPLSRQVRNNYPELKPAPVISHNNNVDNVSSVSSFKGTALETTSLSTNQFIKPQKSQNISARALKRALIKDGFENVSVGYTASGDIVVIFENPVFNRNDLDALGLVLGRVAHFAENEGANYTVQLQNQAIATLSISGNIKQYANFLADNTDPQVSVKRGVMAPKKGITWVGLDNQSSPYFKPRVTLSPALSSTHATELGVYDYSLALRADLTLPIWQGGGFNISAQANLAETEDFESGSAFDARSEESGLKRAVFYQTFALPFNLYNQTQVGFFNEYFDYTGLINETAWLSDSGRHKVSNQFGYFDYQDYQGDRNFNVLSYQYHWVEQDITLHASAGKYWRKDKGAKVETKFWFGDSHISIYAQDTDAQAVGISFSIPLSPRKDMNVLKYGQVRGTESWQHSVSTRIGESHNALVYQRAYTPERFISLDRSIFNQGRIAVDYVHQNLGRMREAFLNYK